MIRAISPLEPIFFSPAPVPEIKNGIMMVIHNVRSQPYHHNGKTTQIICPEIGSILSKTDKRIGIVNNYAVVEVFRKSRGVNRGIVDRIRLQPIYNMVTDQMSVGETDIPYILKLTNHGNWWDKESAKRYDFSWYLFPSSEFKLIKYTS